MYFSHARTAFKYGLIKLGFKAGDKILIPNYICDALLQPIRQLALVPVYFPLNDLLEPCWDELNLLVKINSCRAIVMVHYFGQPQNIDAYKTFCRANELLLLEDNAHGFGGAINGKLLGTFGNLGISSPRKILNTLSGGILYINGEVQEPPMLPVLQVGYFQKFLKSSFSRHPRLKTFVLRSIRRMPNFNDPNIFIEPYVSDQMADTKSALRISNSLQDSSFEKIAQERRKKWTDWSNICSYIGLKPIFNKVHPNSAPWAFPVYAHSEFHRIEIGRVAAKKGLIIFPWPALPKELSHPSSSSVKRWSSIISIPLS